MITLLGVGHVFDLGPRIKEEILRREPDLVCLELDEVRLRALQTQSHGRRGHSIYNMMSFFQRRIAQRYGTHVGGEMLAAYEAAQGLGIPIALIDIDSMITWERLWSSMTPLEAVRLLASSLFALFIGKERVERELERYQQDYTGFMESLGTRYPSVKRTLVDERNEHMALRLRELHRKYGSVLALVGDGHVEGLRASLGTEQLSVIRLWELREKKPSSGDLATA